MNVWKEIDRLQKKFETDLRVTQAAVTELGGGRVRTDEFGFWRASWRPTFGVRHVVRVRAQRGADLVEALRRVQQERREAHAAAKASAAKKAG